MSFSWFSRNYVRLKRFDVYCKRIAHIVGAYLFLRLLRVTQSPVEFCFSPEPYIVINGIKLFYELRDAGNVLSMDVLGRWEPEDLSFVLRNLPDDGVFYDIGANIGWYALNVAKHKPKVKIICFEPCPETLLRNLELNGIRERVKVFGCALGEEDASVHMSDSRDENHVIDGKGKAVTLNRLDTLVQEFSLPSPTFVKMDIEGYEYYALKGGLNTLSFGHPTILCETNDLSLRYHKQPEALISLLSEMGYERCEDNTLTNSVFTKPAKDKMSPVKTNLFVESRQ